MQVLREVDSESEDGITENDNISDEICRDIIRNQVREPGDDDAPDLDNQARELSPVSEPFTAPQGAPAQSKPPRRPAQTPAKAARPPPKNKAATKALDSNIEVIAKCRHLGEHQ